MQCFTLPVCNSKYCTVIILSIKSLAIIPPPSEHRVLQSTFRTVRSVFSANHNLVFFTDKVIFYRITLDFWGMIWRQKIYSVYSQSREAVDTVKRAGIWAYDLYGWNLPVKSWPQHGFTLAIDVLFIPSLPPLSLPGRLGWTLYWARAGHKISTIGDSFHQFQIHPSLFGVYEGLGHKQPSKWNRFHVHWLKPLIKNVRGFIRLISLIRSG